MGNQSSHAADGGGPGGGVRGGEGDVKVCHYELLGIDRQATEDE